ncbi:MAG: glutaredoxin family protein [Actinomycetota bacterium]|nr:glutaredoxin family protein [Actinomycetota bacterium]
MDQQKRVKLYTSPTCSWCRAAKAYMIDNGIEFTEADIISDPGARKEMVLMTGQYGVPVIRAGNGVVVGWNEAEFRRLMELQPKN